MQWPTLAITDPPWSRNVARLMQRTGAIVVPAFFHGANTPEFHFAGIIHPKLRTMLLLRELLKKAGGSIRVSIGNPIRADRLAEAAGFRDATEYLRARTYMLATRTDTAARDAVPHLSFRPGATAIAQTQDWRAMELEIRALPTNQKLLFHGEYQVYAAAAPQIPVTLLEIGRLREITFRQAGEGTGAAFDLDAFDQHYEHLLVWNQEKQEIAGAYRIAKTDTILNRKGVRGLYTNTLFRLHRDFYETVQPALELGRSFVRQEYQRGYLPLLLLWKGIGHYVAANPQYRILFGPVSISKDYSPSSRQLMVSYLKSRHGNQGMAEYVRPRNHFKIRGVRDCDPRNFSSLLANLDELSEVVAELEPDRKGVPILLQKYLNLGGQILEFNVDKKFSNVLDGLFVVDLAKTSTRQLERYMGKENAKNFFARHAPPA